MTEEIVTQDVTQETAPLNVMENPSIEKIEYNFIDASGREYNQDFIEKYKEIVGSINLSNEHGQHILDNVGPILEEMQANDLKMLSDQWVNDSMSDQEIGGDNLVSNVSLASQVVEEFGTEELVEILHKTGMGNHPEVIRFISRIGKVLQGLMQDSFVNNNNSVSPTSSNNIYDSLYPNHPAT